MSASAFALDPQGSPAYIKAMDVLVAISSWELGDSYLQDCLELTEQLSSCLLDS